MVSWVLCKRRSILSCWRSYFWLRQALNKWKCMFVCLSVCSIKVCLELSTFIFLSVSGQSQVSLRSVSGQSQVRLRSVSGQSQVSPCSLRSLLGLPDLTLSVKTEPKILRLVKLVRAKNKIYRVPNFLLHFSLFLQGCLWLQQLVTFVLVIVHAQYSVLWKASLKFRH